MACNCNKNNSGISHNKLARTRNEMVARQKVQLQPKSSPKPNLTSDQRRIKRLKEESIRKNLGK